MLRVRRHRGSQQCGGVLDRRRGIRCILLTSCKDCVSRGVAEGGVIEEQTYEIISAMNFLRVGSSLSKSRRRVNRRPLLVESTGSSAWL